MRYVLLAAVAVGLLGADEAANANKQDLEKMQGTWSVISFVIGGRSVAAEDLKEFRITIKDRTMTHRGAGDATEEGTFVIDALQNPRTIEATSQKGDSKGKKMLGIYWIEDDLMKLCLNQPGQERPKNFESKPDTTIGLMILKREK